MFKLKDDGNIVVGFWFWFSDKVIKEVKILIVSEVSLENGKELVVKFGLRVKDEVINKIGSGDNCKYSIEVEIIVGVWFWEGDEVSFELNFVFVCKVVCEFEFLVEYEFDFFRRF